MTGESRRQKQILWCKHPGREVSGGGPMVSSRGPLGRVIVVAPWWAPCWVESQYGCGEQSGWPPLRQQRTDACGTTQRDPRSPGHRQTKGEGGSRAGSPWPPAGAVCWHTRESTWHGTARPGSRSGSPTPAATGPAWCRGGAAAQSTFSTLPMIFSSKTGRTASSSRTSSNTTPQSNSSLTFLK